LKGLIVFVLRLAIPVRHLVDQSPWRR